MEVKRWNQVQTDAARHTLAPQDSKQAHLSDATKTGTSSKRQEDDDDSREAHSQRLYGCIQAEDAAAQIDPRALRMDGIVQRARHLPLDLDMHTRQSRSWVWALPSSWTKLKLIVLDS